MATEVQIAERQRIMEARAVILHEVPRWIVVLAKPHLPKYEKTRFGFMDWIQNQHDSERWIDHWGKSYWFDKHKPTFVSEPYGPTIKQMNSAKDFADLLGCEVNFDCNSWWNPGATFRIEFLPYKRIWTP